MTNIEKLLKNSAHAAIFMRDYGIEDNDEVPAFRIEEILNDYRKSIITEAYNLGLQDAQNHAKQGIEYYSGGTREIEVKTLENFIENLETLKLKQ